MKMKKTDIGVVVFMYAVCAFFYAYSYKLTEESKTYPMRCSRASSRCSSSSR